MGKLTWYSSVDVTSRTVHYVLSGCHCRKGCESADLVYASEANLRSPQTVIKFYESKLTWHDSTGNTIISSSCLLLYMVSLQKHDNTLRLCSDSNQHIVMLLLSIFLVHTLTVSCTLVNATIHYYYYYYYIMLLLLLLLLLLCCQMFRLLSWSIMYNLSTIVQFVAVLFS